MPAKTRSPKFTVGEMPSAHAEDGDVHQNHSTGATYIRHSGVWHEMTERVVEEPVDDPEKLKFSRRPMMADGFESYTYSPYAEKDVNELEFEWVNNSVEESKEPEDKPKRKFTKPTGYRKKDYS